MNNTKEKKTKFQIIIAVLVLTVILLVEMYLMINFEDSFLPIIILGVVALGDVFVLVNSMMALSAIKEEKRNEHFENLYKSEKASYIMLKKSFDEIEERLNVIQESSKIPAEELINAQKGIAKVIINRSKENADAIINSNDQVLERLDEVEETQNTKFTSLSKEQRLKLTDMGTQAESIFQDLLDQLKDTENRLNQAIMSGASTPSASNYMSELHGAEEISVEDLFASDDYVVGEDINLGEDLVLGEDLALDMDLSTDADLALDTDLSLDELLQVDEEPANEEISLFEEVSALEEELVVEETPVEKELPPMPDLSDPNKALNADEIAALFANMAGGDTPVAEEPAPIVEEVVEEEPVVKETPVEKELPPMPDLSDPNKVMSPDEIAALIANL